MEFTAARKACSASSDWRENLTVIVIGFVLYFFRIWDNRSFFFMEKKVQAREGPERAGWGNTKQYRVTYQWTRVAALESNVTRRYHGAYRETVRHVCQPVVLACSFDRKRLPLWLNMGTAIWDFAAVFEMIRQD